MEIPWRYYMTDQKDDIEITYLPDENDIEKDSKGPEPKITQKDKVSKKPQVSKKIREQLKRQEDILKRVVKERDELKDKYLRNLAEIDNFRKRVKKEKEEYYQYALGEFILNLLPVIDNLERALNSKNAAPDEKSILSGVEMIYKQLIDLLKKSNVEEIESLNQPFDPNFHQALSKVEQVDLKQSLVVEVYQKGYRYFNKLLRPSLTKVAIPKKTNGD
jgi:molecular chaperone GrpE